MEHPPHRISPLDASSLRKHGVSAGVKTGSQARLRNQDPTPALPAPLLGPIFPSFQSSLSAQERGLAFFPETAIRARPSLCPLILGEKWPPVLGNTYQGTLSPSSYLIPLPLVLKSESERMVRRMNSLSEPLYWPLLELRVDPRSQGLADGDH